MISKYNTNLKKKQMRDILNLLDSIVTETALTPKQLAKHNGEYLQTLIQFIGNDLPLAVDPAFRSKFGDYVQIDPAMIPDLNSALTSGDIQNNLPRNLTLLINDEKITAPWGVLLKVKNSPVPKAKNHIMPGTWPNCLWAWQSVLNFSIWALTSLPINY